MSTSSSTRSSTMTTLSTTAARSAGAAKTGHSCRSWKPSRSEWTLAVHSGSFLPKFERQRSPCPGFFSHFKVNTESFWNFFLFFVSILKPGSKFFYLWTKFRGRNIFFFLKETSLWHLLARTSWSSFFDVTSELLISLSIGGLWLNKKVHWWSINSILF